MELVEVLGWRQGPPPEYHVVFHNPSWGCRLSPPDPDGVWLMEQLILRACPDDPAAIVLLGCSTSGILGGQAGVVGCFRFPVFVRIARGRSSAAPARG